jgi:uncharacterized protein YndB with AHSA1/START domain
MPQDGPLPATGSVQVGVAATPEQLWRFVSDPAAPARFSTELVDAHLEDGGPMRIGAVITGTNARGKATWTTHSAVVECDPPRRLSWATGGAEEPTATWTFEVRDAPGGSTLVHSVVLHEGREPFASAIEREPERATEFVEGRMAELLENMALTVQGLSALAEAEVDEPA